MPMPLIAHTIPMRRFQRKTFPEGNEPPRHNRSSGVAGRLEPSSTGHIAGYDDAVAAVYRSLTADQLIAFHQAPRYSGRRFWYFR